MTPKSDLDLLKEELALELHAEAPDFARVVSLAAKLNQQGSNTASFSVDAGMIARLGRELVVRHDTALSELVKNAYDADATFVEVHVARAGYGNFIELTDDGLGMSRNQLVNGFMRLATTAKVAEPVSPKFARRRAGKKGVGRFAAERLGHRLILTTATEDEADALRLDIDWSRFVAGSDLGSVFLALDRVEKTRPHGTLLRIEGLRDSWPASAVERTFGQVAHLIDAGNQVAGQGEGSDFFVRFKVDGAAVSVVDTRTEVARNAFAVVEGKIDSAGICTYGLTCSRLGISFKDRPLRMGPSETSVAEFARDVNLKAHYFLLDRLNISSTAFKTVQAYLSNHGGINVYRNGFRVPPFGQTGDDWLELDQLSSRRTGTLAPIRNRNFLGSVAIIDPDSRFEETSSREGLIESQALEELVRIAQSILLTAVREIDAERERRNMKRERHFGSTPQASAPMLSAGVIIEPPSGAEVAKDLKRIVDRIRYEVATTAGPDEGGLVTKDSLTALEKISKEVSLTVSERDALLKEIDLLRVLASMGLAVGQFTHEFSTLSGAMRADLMVLTELGRTANDREQAAASLRTLLDQARAFSGLFKAMTEDNILRDRQPIDLYEGVTAFKQALKSILDRNGVSFNVVDDGQEVLTPPMHRSELFAVLLNFTTNSIKAVKRAKRSGRILVRLSRPPMGGSLLEFCDNGDGVAPDVKDRMFDAFVTTTAATASANADDDLALGSGLGLTIVRDIVTAVSGLVTLSDAEGEYETCLKVQFPPLTAAT